MAFKPPATIGLPQRTSNFDGEETTLEAKGRHDPCVVPRAVAIVEAMAALALIDAALAQEARAAFREALRPVRDLKHLLNLCGGWGWFSCIFFLMTVRYY